MSIFLVQCDLNQEYSVKENTQNTQNELYQVKRLSWQNRLPQSRRIDPNLQETQQSSSQIQHNISDTETDSAFARIVQVDLWAVLDKWNGSFAVTHDEESVPVKVLDRVARSFVDESGEHTEVEENQEENNQFVYLALLATIVHKDLDELNGGQGECVHCKS